jgi:choline-sulfatase
VKIGPRLDHTAPVKRTSSRRRSLALAAVGAALVLAAGWAAWRALAGSPQESGTGVTLGRLPRGVARADLNLLVITLDTTRADHLGAYGARNVETPNLDTLAREGVLFEEAGAVAPLTLPAHCSMFTGRFPPEHGVRDNGGFFLSPDQTTLAAVLKQAGFATGAVVAAFVLDSKWGLNQGFDTYVDDFDMSKVQQLSPGSVQRPGNEVVDKALPWLQRVKGKRFFGWLHFYDPHTPYTPPEPYRSRYRDRPYDGEIAFVDAQIGRVIEALRQEGLLDKTIIAVLGDHGESLGEHGEDAHGFFIYQSSTHVPFIIRAPFAALGEGRRVADPVREVDLMPTVLDLLGVPVPESVAGTTLIPLMTGARKTLDLEGYSEAMYPLHHYGWSELKGLRSGRFKLIDAPRPELYDLEQDPREQTNVFEARRSLGDTMIRQLRALEAGFTRRGAPAATPTDVDPEVRARLAALGYVGSFVATSAGPKTGRADPKDKRGIFNQMTLARDLAQEEGGTEKAIAMLRQVVASDPEVIDAWFMLGNTHLKSRKFADAIEYFKRALALKPDYDLAIVNMATAYQRMGNDEAALAGYERYLTVDSRNAYVWYMLGEIHLDRGETAKAEANFRQALVIDKRVASAVNALGVIAFQRHDLPASERLVREALAIKSDVRLAHYNLALIAEEKGDLKTAEAEYRRELELHATAYRAAYNLSLIYERAGNRPAQIDALKQSIEANPDFAEGHFSLARVYLAAGADLAEAARLARKGLELAPASPLAPLGHFVLADILLRQGRVGEANRELEAGRSAEARHAPRSR